MTRSACQWTEPRSAVSPSSNHFSPVMASSSHRTSRLLTAPSDPQPLSCPHPFFSMCTAPHSPPSVIFLVTDNTLNPILNPSEVASLFSMPLAAFLYAHPSKIPGWHFGIATRVAEAGIGTLVAVPPPPPIPYAERKDEEGEVGGKEGRYYGYRDISWGQGKVRMHRFLTGREGVGVRPVYGLTA